jgi:hypothetical protein
MRNPLLPDKLSRRRGEAAWTGWQGHGGARNEMRCQS